MRRVGQARKRDGNERTIVAALQACGAQVLKLGAKDAPDLLVRVGSFVNVSDVPPGKRWGKYVLMEVKTTTGRVKQGQKDFAALWPEVVIIRSVDEALAAIGAVRSEAGTRERTRR